MKLTTFDKNCAAAVRGMLRAFDRDDIESVTIQANDKTYLVRVRTHDGKLEAYAGKTSR